MLNKSKHADLAKLSPFWRVQKSRHVTKSEFEALVV